MKDEEIKAAQDLSNQESATKFQQDTINTSMCRDDTQKETLIPQKKDDKVVYLMIFIIGVGVLLPWNVISGVIDYFQSLYSVDLPSPSFDWPLAINAPNVIGQLLIIKWGHKLSAKFRLVSTFTAILILMVLLIIVSKFAVGMTSWVINFIICMLIGFSYSVTQATAFGIAGSMPFKYMTAIMIGNGVSGILANIVRIICLAAIKNNLFMSTLIYFIIAYIILIICIIASIILFTRDFTNQCLKEAKPAKTMDIIEESPSIIECLKRVWRQAISVFLVFFVTFIVFPGTIIVPTANIFGVGKNYSWFVIIMLTEFNVFDTLGRFSPNIIRLFNKKVNIYVCISRFIFVGIFLLIASSVHSFLQSIWFKIIHMAFYSFTNGCCSSLAMGYAPSLFEADEGKKREKAGQIMSFFLVIGICLGCFVALGMSPLCILLNPANET